jgi:antitoxin HicB
VAGTLVDRSGGGEVFDDCMCVPLCAQEWSPSLIRASPNARRPGGGVNLARAKPIVAKQYVYTAVFDPVAEGGLCRDLPALPGLVTEGETLEDARLMAEDALRCYLQGHLEDGLPVPFEEEASLEAIRDAVSVTIQAG